nr:hypothetical protein [Caballeronia hypogeia]
MPVTPSFDDLEDFHPTIKYHRGAAFHASATRVGNVFMASASILEEDGHSTSLGRLGAFASEDVALGFAVRCATAFIDGDEMPLPPFQTIAQ